MVIAIDRRFADMVESVARELVTTEHFGTASVVKTPLLYPSGAGVVVEVSEHGPRYFVTDMGYGYQECEMNGASTFYSNSARQLAEHYGIRFDNQAFFVAEATREQLPGAVVTVANCSCEATARAIYRAAERRSDEDADKLYVKLKQAFPKNAVERDQEFAGSSNHKWNVAAIVRSGPRVALFEAVNKAHVSVVTAATKFHDIGRLETPPIRIAVVKNKAELGDLFNVIAQAST